MATNLYVANDGTIHRKTGLSVDTLNVQANINNPSLSNNLVQNKNISRISTGRIVWFWIVSLIVSLLIGIGINACLGSYTGRSEYIPIVVILGALVGSIVYGIFFAKKLDYNLWTYILSAFSAPVGIIALGIAIAVICAIIAICLAILGLAIVVGIIYGLLSAC